MKIPSKTYLKKAEEIFYKKIFNKNNQYDFNRIRRAYQNSKDLKNLLSAGGIKKIYEISSGTSDRPAYQAYLDQAISDITNKNFYQEYTTADGNLEARMSLSFMESLKLKNFQFYSDKEICLTVGSTSAITMVFEYIKKSFPGSEILIVSPAYYIYKLAAQYYNLSYKEILPIVSIKEKYYKSFISITSLIESVTGKTKLIVIANPANPSGEIYDPEDLKKLLLVAKKKNILVMVDELFEELVFDKEVFVSSDQIASEENALRNLVIIKGFSKTKNLAGFRIGYLFSKNATLMDNIYKIAEQRWCFPAASNFTGLISLDAFIKSVDFLVQKNNFLDISKIIEKVKREFSFCRTIKFKDTNNLTEIYKGYKQFTKKLMKFYSQRFDESLRILKDDIELKMPKQSAFNTMVKIKDLSQVNFFDFCLNLYLTCGVKAEMGPCFGFDQQSWEKNPQLGFWLRISFSRDKYSLNQGLRKFLDFKKAYLSSKKNVFLKTNLCF